MRANVETKHQFRFVSNSGTSSDITDQLIITAAGVMASTTTVGNALSRSVKVNKIEIWSPPASQGAAATCSILFPSANNSPSREFSDTTVSVSSPAHVSCSPPPNSLAGFWQQGVGVTMFTLVAPAGSIIDLWVSLVQHDGTGAGSATLVAATVGRVYYCSLDSATSAGSKYTPVSLASL